MSAAADNLKRALSSLDKKLYQKASSEFAHAISLDSEGKVLKKLRDLYEDFAASNSYESALAVGLSLLKHVENRSNLANILGNFSRRSGNYEQALSLFKVALKSDAKHEYALYNIGATLARSSRQDKEVIHAFDYFPVSENYIIPEYFSIGPDYDYICNPDYIKEIAANISANNRESLSHPSDDEPDIELDSFFENDIEGVINDITGPNTSPPEAEENSKTYLEYFDKLSELSPDFKQIYQYNKAIYCLKKKLFPQAREVLLKMKPGDTTPLNYVPILSAIILVQENEVDHAEQILLGMLNKPLNRYAYTNLGLLYRLKKDRIRAVKYLLAAYEMLQFSNWQYEVLLFIKKLHAQFKPSPNSPNKVSYLKLVQEGTDDPLVYYYLAFIHLSSKEYIKASNFFKKSIEVDRSGRVKQEAEIQLSNLVDFLEEEGENFFNRNKFKNACEYFYMAYQIEKNILLAKKILNTFNYFTPDEKELELKEKIKADLIEMEKEKKNSQAAAAATTKATLADRKMEMRWQSLVQEAEKNVQDKKYHNAMEKYESAFRMKPEKDTFLKLAGLYKAFKKNEQLIDLAGRFKRQMELDEKAKQFEDNKGSSSAFK